MEKYNSKDPLVSFLYILLRDHLPAGKVEKLVQDANAFCIKYVVKFEDNFVFFHKKNIINSKLIGASKFNTYDEAKIAISNQEKYCKKYNKLNEQGVKDYVNKFQIVCIDESIDETVFTNGYLAQYAENLANRLNKKQK